MGVVMRIRKSNLGLLCAQCNSRKLELRVDFEDGERPKEANIYYHCCRCGVKHFVCSLHIDSFQKKKVG